MKIALLSLCLLLSASFVFAQKGQAGIFKDGLIVLTFDDGPRPGVLFDGNSGKGLADLLGDFGIPAHFFAQGSQIASYPDVVRSLARRGFFVENHTYGHDNLKSLYQRKGVKAVMATLKKNAVLIERLTGRRPKYMRPPFWEFTSELNEPVSAAGYTIMKLGDPDINTLDYEDQAAKGSEAILIERVRKIMARREKTGVYRHVFVFHELPVTARALSVLIPDFVNAGYRFGTLDEYFSGKPRPSDRRIVPAMSVSISDKSAIQAAYLGVDVLYGKKLVERFIQRVKQNRLNAVVIDFKVDAVQDRPEMRRLIERLHGEGYYIIGRIVVLQDHRLALRRPHLALRHADGTLWYSGAKEWRRYWVDPASPEVLAYNVEISKKAVDIGFDELNYDYIRFPSDGRMRDLVYPVWDGITPKYDVMRKVFAGLAGAVKSYNPRVKLPVDIFGEAFAYGGEPGVGQRLSDLAEYFDAIAPMAYPSHYRCREFGFKDPTGQPRQVYARTLQGGKKILGNLGYRGEIRPWLQDFSISSIYGCGPLVPYGPVMLMEQIQGCRDAGVNGFMMWNGSSRYTLLPPDWEKVIPVTVAKLDCSCTVDIQ